MRQSKIGDVYSIKLPNGYKLFQRAYDIPRQGRFIRVFDGLYETIPDNIAEIIAGPHSYIIDFYASRAYRIGLVHFVENHPVPEEYPFPEYQFTFWPLGNSGKYGVKVVRTDLRELHVFSVSGLDELPEPFHGLTLVGEGLSPEWVLYLFDVNWSPSDLSNYTPGCSDRDIKTILQPYADMVEECMVRDKASRKQNN